MAKDGRLIIHGRVVEQVIDRGRTARFHKELVITSGRAPLAMVRKRTLDFDGATRAPVLLVHGFGQNRYAWHLPMRSMANALAEAGYDVFNLDLRGHGRSRQLGAPPCRSVEDYVREDLPSAVEAVQRLADGRKVLLVGHSLGGLVSCAAAPNLDGAIAGVATIGSPYHFTSGSISLSAIAWFVQALQSTPARRIDAPLGVKHVGAALRLLRKVAESPLYPIPFRGWHKGAIEPDVLGAHFRLAFDRAGLVELSELFAWGNSKRFLGEETDAIERFERMQLPLLVISGSHDDLAPPESVHPAYARSQSSDRTYRSFPLGHIDLLVGHDAPLMTWSVVRRWMDARTAGGLSWRRRASVLPPPLASGTLPLTDDDALDSLPRDSDSPAAAS